MATTRRTQEERRAQTQAKIIDAVIACLIEEGHAAVTFGNIAERAGISRGAILHHFPDRQTLMIAAIEHLWGARRAELITELEGLAPGDDRLPQALDLVWESFAGPLWGAAFEVWSAARTDAQLRSTLTALERTLTAEIHRLSADLVGAAPSGRRAFNVVIDDALATMRGLAMLASHRDAKRIRATWAYSRARILEQLRDL